jgi:citrate lyase subunit beta/citryl-CoA lyase
MTLDIMPKVAGQRSWVRINGLSTGFFHEDVEALVGAKGLVGFIVPKMDSLEEVSAVDKLIASVEYVGSYQLEVRPLL